ncbi:hypothetical protein HNV08_05030 [Winogradskyella eckloniae]|uniref:hypothetical protein n=1 Tax=Winogradskyella eckloniae TaxID=1089306 RepID=UPI001566AC20|nr:hypothetical protein [Winogradskyella eckloniae]NRD19402.1 hypothetical protein [Winogradskyella eckloniae]
MFKNICTLLILFVSLTCFSQDFKLIKNKHPQAKELKHNLNKTKDTLVLECNNKILAVDFFNEDFEKKIIINDVKTKISLQDIPEGKFIVEAKLTNKIILIDLIRHKSYNDTSQSDINEPAEGMGMMLDETLNIIKAAPNKSLSFMLNRSNEQQKASTQLKFYWIESQVINKIGSSKTMRLADQDSVDRMILKHKEELKSDCGKLNTLTIWEVYNTSEFMENQASNPDFVYSSSTDIFNSTPYYSTNGNTQDL